MCVWEQVLLLLHAIIPCLGLHAAPCFYALPSQHLTLITPRPVYFCNFLVAERSDCALFACNLIQIFTAHHIVFRKRVFIQIYLGILMENCAMHGDFKIETALQLAAIH